MALMSTVSSIPIRKKLFERESFWGYLFIFPIVFGIYFFSIGPILFSFAISLTNWDSLTIPDFTGLSNFGRLFSDSEMRREILNTFQYTLWTVPVGIIIALFFANSLNKKIIMRGFFRILYYLPVITMPMAVGIVWRQLFNSEYGLINNLFGFFGIKGPMWLADSHFIMPAIIIVAVWSQIGYNIVIILAGLQGISESLYEAADIEGAGGRIKFFRITLPLISPTLFFLSTMNLISAFKQFDLIYVFAGGADNFAQGPMLTATRTMAYGIFEKGFAFMRMGYASAEAVVLFLIILVFTIFQFTMQDKWVFYG
jgi:multiple sugar transport system permease protein